MSSVRKKDQTEHRFTVLDKALDLYEHTSTLIANEKVFDRTYKGLIDKIDNASMMIYHCCRSANEDFDARVKEDAAMRLKLQEEAIENCKWLKSYIRLSKRKFHLRTKKVIYWNGKHDVDMHFKAYKTGVRYGNSHNLIYRLNKWYKSLWEGAENAQ